MTPPTGKKSGKKKHSALYPSNGKSLTPEELEKTFKTFNLNVKKHVVGEILQRFHIVEAFGKMKESFKNGIERMTPTDGTVEYNDIAEDIMYAEMYDDIVNQAAPIIEESKEATKEIKREAKDISEQIVWNREDQENCVKTINKARESLKKYEQDIKKMEENLKTIEGEIENNNSFKTQAEEELAKKKTTLAKFKEEREKAQREYERVLANIAIQNEKLKHISAVKDLIELAKPDITVFPTVTSGNVEEIMDTMKSEISHTSSAIADSSQAASETPENDSQYDDLLDPQYNQDDTMIQQEVQSTLAQTSEQIEKNKEIVKKMQERYDERKKLEEGLKEVNRFYDRIKRGQNTLNGPYAYWVRKWDEWKSCQGRKGWCHKSGPVDRCKNSYNGWSGDPMRDAINVTRELNGINAFREAVNIMNSKDNSWHIPDLNGNAYRLLNMGWNLPPGGSYDSDRAKTQRYDHGNLSDIINGMINKLDQFRNKVSRYIDHIHKNMGLDLEVYRENIELLNNELEHAAAGSLDQILLLKEKLRQLVMKQQDIQKVINEKIKNILIMEKEIEELIAKSEELAVKLGEDNIKLETKKEEYKILINKMIKIKDEIARLLNDLEVLKKKAEELLEEKEKIIEEQRMLKEILQDLEYRLKLARAGSTQYGSAQYILDDIEAKRAELIAKQQELEAKLAELEKIAEEIKQKLTLLEQYSAEYATLDTQRIELEKEMDEIRAEIEATKKKIEEYDEQIDKNQAIVNQELDDVKDLTKELDDTTKETDETIDQLEEAEKLHAQKKTMVIFFGIIACILFIYGLPACLTGIFRNKQLDPNNEPDGEYVLAVGGVNNPYTRLENVDETEAIDNTNEIKFGIKEQWETWHSPLLNSLTATGAISFVASIGFFIAFGITYDKYLVVHDNVKKTIDKVHNNIPDRNVDPL